MARTVFIFDGLNLNDGGVYHYIPGVELGARQKTWDEYLGFGGMVRQVNVSEAGTVPMKFPMRVQGTSLADLNAKVQAINAKIDGCSSDVPRALVFAGMTYAITTSPRVAYVFDEVVCSCFSALIDLVLNRSPLEGLDVLPSLLSGCVGSE